MAGFERRAEGAAVGGGVLYCAEFMSGRIDHVTLCTVLTPAHVALASLNQQIVTGLNRGPIRWSVTYNPEFRDPSGARQAGEPPTPLADLMGPGATVRLGPTLEQTFERVFSGSEAAQPDSVERRRLLGKYIGSYHHAAGLRLALEDVRTRFAILIDPDFYVVRRGWIDDVLSYMAAEGMAVFGAPWSPRWYQKYRSFPSTHLMVIDLQRCPWAKAGLEPDLIAGGRRFASDTWSRLAAGSKAEKGMAMAEIFRNPWRAIREDLRQRTDIGAARDTGYALLERCRRRPEIKIGLLQPVFDPRERFMPDAVSPLQIHPLVEALMPPSRRYLPSRSSYFSRKGFESFGLRSVRGQGWEEFLWKGQPFATHVRGELQRARSGSIDPEHVRETLNAVLIGLDLLGLQPL